MWILVEESTFPRPCFIWRWNLGRPIQGAGGSWLEIPNLRSWGSEFSWLSRILRSVYSGFLQNCQAHEYVALEGWEICMDTGVWGSFSRFMNIANYCSYFSIAWHWETVWCILWCLRYRFRVCFNAGRLSHCLCLVLVEKAWSQLSNTWFRACSSCPSSKNLVTLPAW